MELDSINRHILSILERALRCSLSRLARARGLSAPSVAERIDKLGERHHSAVTRQSSMPASSEKNITAFIGVFIDHPRETF